MSLARVGVVGNYWEVKAYEPMVENPVALNIHTRYLTHIFVRRIINSPCGPLRCGLWRFDFHNRHASIELVNRESFLLWQLVRQRSFNRRELIHIALLGLERTIEDSS
jgi:hypothetical protein